MSVSRAALSGLAILLCQACQEPVPSPSSPAPRVIFGGCLELSSSHCTLETPKPKRLSAWLDVRAGTPIRVLADGKPIPSTGRVVLGGVRISMEIPARTRSVTIESVDEAWEPAVELLVTWEDPRWVGRTPDEETRRRLATQSDGWKKLRLLDTLRRSNRGKEDGLQFGAEELQLARELGAPMHQTMVLGTQARALIEAGSDLSQAREILDALEPLTEQSSFAASRWHYVRGLLARRTGDLGSALEHLTAARTLYEQLDETAILDPLEMEAVTLADLGRVDDAQKLRHQAFAHTHRGTLKCEDEVRRANNIGWSELVLRSAGLGDPDPRPMLIAALSRIDECPDEWFRTSLLLDLALVEVQEGAPEPALGWLAQAHEVDPELEAWFEEVLVQASTQHPDTSLHPPLMQLPLPTSEPQLRWNQTVRRANTFAIWGFTELAADEYRSAEAQLTESLNRVGTDAGSAPYLAGRTASLEGLVESLVSLGRPREASCALRMARSRELARLDRVARLNSASDADRTSWEREILSIATEQDRVDRSRANLRMLADDERVRADAQLTERDRVGRSRLDGALGGLGLESTPNTCDELRAPRPGEVILTIYDSFVFATSEDGVEMATLAALDTIDVLGEARHISIIEVGDRPAIATHTLPWRGFASLLDLAAISYSLDLRARPPSTPPRDRALVVADPRNDLPKSVTEAGRVSQSLKALGWSVAEALGARATRSLLVAQLPLVDLFHYAGHGVREGVSGWESALLLADDERFGVPDVFTLPSVPAGVVLTGCETAAVTPQTVGGGMNLARAFILSGSDWVIAADAEVSDEHAAAVGVAMYDAAPLEGPARLREALISLRKKDPKAPWQHFRAITP